MMLIRIGFTVSEKSEILCSENWTNQIDTILSMQML
jgi:hypothetical protein